MNRTSVRQPDENEYWTGHEITSRLGTWYHEGGKQPVVFLSIGKERTAVLGYDALTNLIDSLCRQKERLREKIFTQPNFPEKTLRFYAGR